MFKAVVASILALTVLLGAIVFIKWSQINALIAMGESFTPPPTAISSTKVKSHIWQETLSAIGSLEAAKGLVVTADLPGRVSKIFFDAGSQVKAGDLLVQQDTSTEKAQLRSAQASAALAKSNLSRIKELYTKNVASKSELDNAESSYQSAVAEVDNIKATIAKKSIRAPFNGHLGIRLVNLGQTINAGEPVVSLQATDQMFINFFLPQQSLGKLQTGLSVNVTTDAVPGKIFKGTINAIDPEIDTATRNLKVQAILANENKELLPGMFANIEVVLPNTSKVLLIPITAVQYATFGDSVFVIEEKAAEDGQENNEPSLIAKQAFVKLGKTRGDYIVVNKGLSEGDAIVSIGGFKLRKGAPIVINNNVVPDFDLAPAVLDK